uniref:Putative tail protein n=1 Tax=viral metagenome TaxID=1070528 RepID=A0A6M3KQF5_9ZZZZ
MAIDVIKVIISEAVFVPTAVPPTPGTITATGLRRGVHFLWPGVSIAPCYWQVRFQVASAGWSTWTRIDSNFCIRELTAAEKTVNGTTANIQIQVRSTNGVDFSAGTTSANANCLAESISITPGGDAVSNILAANLGTALEARLWDDSTKNGFEILAGSIAAGQLGTDAVETLKIKDLNVTTGKINDLAVTTGKINDLAVTEGKIGALAVTTGKIANLAVTSDKIEDGAVSVVCLAADTLLQIFEASGRAKLDDVLYSGATSLKIKVDGLDASDRLLIAIGTHKNVTLFGSSIKTDLSLNNVENKSSATIRGELTPTNLTTATGVLTTNVIASVNASAEATKIAKAAIATVMSSHVQKDGNTDPIFDTFGRLLTSIYSGGSEVTAGNIINSTLGNLSINLDLTSIGAGTLDNIPETGSDKTVTANEKSGAGRAYVALDSSNRLIESLYDGSHAFTPSVVYQGLIHYRTLFSEHITEVTGPITTSVVWPSTTFQGQGIGNYVCILKFKFVYNVNDLYLKGRFDLKAKNNDLAHIRLTVYAEGGGSDAGDPVSLTAAGYHDIVIDLTSAGLIPGTFYEVRLEMEGNAANEPILLDPQGSYEFYHSFVCESYYSA